MHVTKWKKQSAKAIYCRIPTIGHFGKEKTTGIVRSVVARG